METWRDLAPVQPRQESRERSLARKGELTRTFGESERSLDRQEELARGGARRARKLLGVGAVVTLAVLMITLPGAIPARSANAAPRPSASAASILVGSASGSRAASDYEVLGLWRTGVKRRALRQSGSYLNPLAGARVTPERIDQGVDYAGTGTLGALGAAQLTYVSSSGTGWPGAFIEYRLLAGPDRGRYVYYAEGVTPVPGLHVGTMVRAGQAVATLIAGWDTGIEIGWGADIGTETYAAEMGQWSTYDGDNNIASAAGKSFSALIGSLGGPRGKVEG